MSSISFGTDGKVYWSIPRKNRPVLWDYEPADAPRLQYSWYIEIPVEDDPKGLRLAAAAQFTLGRMYWELDQIPCVSGLIKVNNLDVFRVDFKLLFQKDEESPIDKVRESFYKVAAGVGKYFPGVLVHDPVVEPNNGEHDPEAFK